MAQVQLILREDVRRLGEAGDLVSVKPGYARNFLVPQGKAILATVGRVKELDHQKRVISERLAKEMADFEAVKQRMASVVLEFSAQAGDEGKLFGSITAQQIGEQLAEKGFKIDRRKIELDEPIKALGEHQVPVKLRSEIVAEVKVIVTAAD
ncbi:MAG: 50S ribosomal protein L9 [bacterium TMED88]|nr:50S ribosomal protein L9 [Deltaproteobacteria bacterium]OUV37339.1 MAG: 50S ribosomal protein L9 [bacterium TMED88]